MFLAALCVLESGLQANAKPTFTTFNPGGAYGTDASAINDSGTVAGSYGCTSLQDHGFVRSANGGIATFDVPLSHSTDAEDLNNNGLTTGKYEYHGIFVGFVRTPQPGNRPQFAVQKPDTPNPQ